MGKLFLGVKSCCQILSKLYGNENPLELKEWGKNKRMSHSHYLLLKMLKRRSLWQNTTRVICKTAFVFRFYSKGKKPWLWSFNRVFRTGKDELRCVSWQRNGFSLPRVRPRFEVDTRFSLYLSLSPCACFNFYEEVTALILEFNDRPEKVFPNNLPWEIVFLTRYFPRVENGVGSGLEFCENS